MRSRKAKISPLEQRNHQITKERDEIFQQLAAKTRRQFKTEQGYQSWRVRQQEKLAELDDELSILNDPGEYEELPPAIIAEELGLTLDEVSSMIYRGELEPSDTSEDSKKNRVDRAELERALDIGAEELLRLSNQESSEIFEDAIPYFHNGNIEQAEKAYQRIYARDSWRGSFAPACEVALDLLKGNLEDAQTSVKYICEYDSTDGTTILTYLGRLLRGMGLHEHGAQVLLDQLLAITEGANRRPFDTRFGWDSKQLGKHQDETQRQAMYLTAAVQHALEKYRFIQQFKSYHSRSSKMREEEFEDLVRSAIYTALYAEVNYNEFPASKMYVDKLVAGIPRWWAPAKLLALLPDTRARGKKNDADGTL